MKHLQSMVTVGSYSSVTQAQLVRARLEAGEVPAFVIDENIVTMDWLLWPAIGGVKVQVAEENAERAKEILEAIPIEEFPEEGFDEVSKERP